MTKVKQIALIAHDNKKPEIIEWAQKNKDILSKFSLCGTKNNLQELINKLKQSELTNFEQLIRENKQVGEENFEKMFITKPKSFMHYDTWQRLMNKTEL